MKAIDKREERTIKRKLAKKKFDDIINLSVMDLAKKPQTVRLLDEGAIVMDENEAPYAYIVKGTLEKALLNMPEDYENYIDLGHMPLATFPISLGVMRKSDLHLVETGNGRHGLDVDVNLDYSNPIVKALQAQPFDLAVSARFSYELDMEKTREISEMFGTYVEVINDIFIDNFAIVGEPGNVNSGGLKLKGETTQVDVKELAKALENTEGKKLDLSVLSDAIEQIVSNEETVQEELSEEVAEESVEIELNEEVSEEPEAELAEEVVEETIELSEEMAEESVEEISEEPEITLNVEEILSKIDELTDRVSELEAENASLKESLAEKDRAAEAIIQKISSLSVSREKEERLVTNTPIYTDGFGK